MHVTSRPRSECVKEIIQAGVSRVLIPSDGGISDVESKAGDLMMIKRGVGNCMYVQSGRKISIDV